MQIFVSIILCFSIGVGIFANDNAADNNSVLVADNNNNIGTIYCGTGSRASNIGQWFTPNKTQIQPGNSLFSVVRGGGNFPAYVGLQLRSNRALTKYDEGIYICEIPDENGATQTLNVGIFRYGSRCKFKLVLKSTLC